MESINIDLPETKFIFYYPNDEEDSLEMIFKIKDIQYIHKVINDGFTSHDYSNNSFINKNKY
jgi:hypothetical protein